MQRLKRAVGMLSLCAGALSAPNALADSADAPECSIPGKACTTSRVPDGICATGQCWVCDGDKAMTYSCPRCQSAEEIAAAGAPAAPPEAAPKCTEEDDGGCTVHQLGSERGIGALFLAVGLGAFLWGRRRRGAPRS